MLSAYHDGLILHQIMSHCVPPPPALLLPLISHPDLPCPALHLRCARRASPRCSLLPLPLGVLTTTGGYARDIRHPTHSSTTSSASLVLLFVSRCFYSSMSISSKVFLSIYTFILFSSDRDAASKSLSGSDVALTRAASLPEFILLHKPPL